MQTYAIRLAVEGGGQVKAELISVGQSGEQSLKRIESAGERASGGLKGLGRQAELLRTGIRTLGGALIGTATVGGLGALIDRSISAADAIGKTADKIGVGVEALQELRFAAKASGVEQHTLDMALQRFTRRAAEAAQGTGEAKDALAQMGIALRDQSGNLRRSEDLLSDVADAFARIEDPAERVRLAFKLFDSEGVALVNLLRGGSDAPDEMREPARSPLAGGLSSGAGAGTRVCVHVDLAALSRMLAHIDHAVSCRSSSGAKCSPRRLDHATRPVELNGLGAEVVLEPCSDLMMCLTMIGVARIDIRAGAHDRADSGFVQIVNRSIEQSLRTWLRLPRRDRNHPTFLPSLDSLDGVNDTSPLLGRELVHRLRRREPGQLFDAANVLPCVVLVWWRVAGDRAANGQLLIGLRAQQGVDRSSSCRFVGKDREAACFADRSVSIGKAASPDVARIVVPPRACSTLLDRSRSLICLEENAVIIGRTCGRILAHRPVSPALAVVLQRNSVGAPSPQLSRLPSK
jgi:hypothetical protein